MTIFQTSKWFFGKFPRQMFYLDEWKTKWFFVGDVSRKFGRAKMDSICVFGSLVVLRSCRFSCIRVALGLFGCCRLINHHQGAPIWETLQWQLIEERPHMGSNQRMWFDIKDIVLTSLKENIYDWGELQDPNKDLRKFYDICRYSCPNRITEEHKRLVVFYVVGRKSKLLVTCFSMWYHPNMGRAKREVPGVIYYDKKVHEEVCWDHSL